MTTAEGVVARKLLVNQSLRSEELGIWQGCCGFWLQSGFGSLGSASLMNRAAGMSHVEGVLRVDLAFPPTSSSLGSSKL